MSKILSKYIASFNYFDKSLTVLSATRKKLSKIKKSIRMMKSQRSDSENIYLIEEGKKIGIDEIINNSLNSQI